MARIYHHRIAELDQVDLEASVALRLWKYRKVVERAGLVPCQRLDCKGAISDLWGGVCLLCARPATVRIECLEPRWRLMLELAMGNSA